MPLNSIPNEVADSLVVLYAPRISDPLPSRRYEAHLALGALAWRAGHTTVMREHLLHTAELGASMLETAGPLPFADPWELALPVLCAVVFARRGHRTPAPGHCTTGCRARTVQTLAHVAGPRPAEHREP